MRQTNKECESCIHNQVCAYKEHYEDVIKLYKASIDEAGKYPWFKLEIRCVQYAGNYPMIAASRSADKIAQAESEK